MMLCSKYYIGSWEENIQHWVQNQTDKTRTEWPHWVIPPTCNTMMFKLWNTGILDSNGIPSCTSAGCVLQLCKVS